MRRRRRNELLSNINVVPYLDVLLVLLVIFMITAPLFNQGVVDLPKVGEKPLPAAEQTAMEIVYELGEVNPYRLIDHAEGEETPPLGEAELLQELRKKRILYDQGEGWLLPVIISADKNLQYDKVVNLLGLLNDEGHYKLALSAETSGQ